MLGKRLGIASVLAGVLLSSWAALAQDTVRVGRSGREAFSFVPVDIGSQVGIFKKHNINVEIADFSGDARLQQAMAADTIDVGLGGGPGMAFIVKGAPIKAVAAFAGPPLLFALIVPKDSPLKTSADLNGKTIGVSGVGSVTQWLVNQIALKQGWDLGSVNVVGIGENAARLAAVKSKAIDGAVLDIATALNYVQSGEGRILARFGDTVGDFHVHVMFATNKAMGANPKAVSHFVAGWFETIAYMRQNKAKSVEIAAEIMGTDQKLAGQIYDELMPMFADKGNFNPKALDVLSKSFVELKILPSEPDMKTLYTEAYLPK